MRFSKEEILRVLDDCCGAFTFPMLDNGYVYLAATRLTLFRSPDDWAMTIEVFGFSPRAGLPDVHVYSFGGTLCNRKGPDDYVSREAYDNYLTNNPHNESRFIYAVAEGDWLDGEAVSGTASEVVLRDEAVRLPTIEELSKQGIEVEDEKEIRVFELCRYLAAIRRSAVLATTEELRANISPRLVQVLQLDEWNHPNVVDDECRPSGSKTFQQLAEVLMTGDVSVYQPTLPPNTHWKNWPEGGTL
jgi:hypothetical protein